jgi:hypothetical protein
MDHGSGDYALYPGSTEVNVAALTEAARRDTRVCRRCEAFRMEGAPGPVSFLHWSCLPRRSQMRRSIVFFAALTVVFATAHLAYAETVAAAGASEQTSAPAALQASPASTQPCSSERAAPANVVPGRGAPVGFGWG